MAMSEVSQPRDNMLEALRMLVEERKREVKEVFLELRTALEQCEEGVNEELSKLYSDTREGVERDEKKIQKLESVKIGVQTGLVDNEFSYFLQATIDNFDTQIAEIRRSSVTIPRYVRLEWKKEEMKRSIQTLCRIVSSQERNHSGSGQTVQASDVSQSGEDDKILKQQLKDVQAEMQCLAKSSETTNRQFNIRLKATNTRSRGTVNWKCPLCDRGFRSEVEKDIHMTKDC